MRRTGTANDPLWYKDAIIYELPVKSFHDGNADGIGDFKGLCEKLDYLQSLGVTCLWLLPFFPSPLKDDGYDIADYVARASELRRRWMISRHSCMRRTTAACRWSSSWSSTTRPISIRGSSAHGRRRPDRRSATITCGAIPTSAISRRGSSSSIPSARTGRGIRSRRRTTGTGSFSISRISTTTTRRSSARCWRCWISGSIWASTASGSTPCRTWSSAMARPAKICPRRTPSSRRSGAHVDARAPGRMLLGRGQPVAGRRAGLLRRRRRMPHGLSLPGHAAHLHGAAPGGSAADHRRDGADAGHS